jgi:hypothetical protein
VKLPFVTFWELTFGARRAAERARLHNFMMALILLEVDETMKKS